MNLDSPFFIFTLQHFLEKIEILNSCWEWKAGKSKNGYGKFRDGNKHVLAHQFAFELFKGDMPEGFELDHLCRNKLCVNPNHLEAVTHKENTLRGFGPTAINAKKTHCKRGHELKEDNLIKSDLEFGWRRCRICRNLRKQGII